MQSIPTILKVTSGSGQWCADIFGSVNPDSPIIRLAMSAKLRINLCTDQQNSATGILTPFPYEEVAACASFYVAIDSDWNQLTIPPIKKFSGITVTQDAVDNTILDVELPNLDSPELRNAVKTNEFVNLKGEVGGLDADGKSIFLVDFTIRLKNRVWIPDGSSGDEPDPSDPDYLTTPQVKAYIESELAAAVADLELPQGEIGPEPVITIGTVQTGTSADASIAPVSGTPGAYILNLTLPRATDGSTPEPITPTITIGTVETGDEAAVTITPVAGTPGTYTLNLTLPRGTAGAGVTPRGQWSAETTYTLNDAVRHASAWWRSLQADNLNHPPPATRDDSEFWEVIVADGLSADPLIVAYNSIEDPDDGGWHLPPWQPGDAFFRMSTDGGVTHSQAFPLTQPAPTVIVQYNPDAVTDWRDIPAPVGTADYCLATGRYYRLRVVGGIWGPAAQIHDLDVTEQLRVQYAVTPASGEPEWHGVLQPGDNRIRFYNLAGTIRKDISISLEPGQQIDRAQTCAIASPWHATYAPDTDVFMKLSTDGGETFGSPMRVKGKSAYEEWIEAGNAGTIDDFLNSLKGANGAPGAGIQFDASGTIAERDNYDSTPLGFVFLASDGDGFGGAALFQRSSATQGMWSGPVPVTPGPPGADGKDGAPGIPGADAPIVPDFEFASAELLEDIDHGNYLLIDGIIPIAQVELYNTAGDGVVIERGDAAENGRCMIVTRYTTEQTIIYFGELDVSRGGRVRFAQGSTSSGGSDEATGITAAEARAIAKKQALIFG